MLPEPETLHSIVSVYSGNSVITESRDHLQGGQRLLTAGLTGYVVRISNYLGE